MHVGMRALPMMMTHPADDEEDDFMEEEDEWGWSD